MSTDVTLTIQDGKLTWIEQKGDELPVELWNNLNVAIANVFNKYSLGYAGYAGLTNNPDCPCKKGGEE
jgi:hypothetical protein